MNLKKSDMLKTMSHSSPRDFFQARNRYFSLFWFEIVRTRLVLCIIIASLTYLNPRTGNPRSIYFSLSVYVALNLLLGVIEPSFLRLKRWKIVREIADIVLISVVIYYSSEANGILFLLYIFPIMSASKYWGNVGPFVLAALSISVYGLSVSNKNGFDIYSFSITSLVFLGVAVVAGNLVRLKQKEEEKLIEFFEEIDNAILSDQKTDEVLKLILNKAIEFTGSDMGQLSLTDSEEGKLRIVTDVGTNQLYERTITRLTEGFFGKVKESKNPSLIKNVDRRRLKQEVGNSFSSFSVLPGSALFVPLLFKDSVIGIIAVFSRRKFHYTDEDKKKLGSFTPLIAIARKNAEMYKKLSSSAEERKERLKMLLEIGEQLRAEQELGEMFEKVVELTFKRLGSEEAALFVPDLEKPNCIRKVAVKGPSGDLTKKLKDMKESYKRGESLAGKVFETSNPDYVNEIPPDVEYFYDFFSILPSKKVAHWIGVPLVIGKEVLGVIRVINKRAATYYENYELSPEGFSDEDFELLQTIAIYVASAIKTAGFIDDQRYYKSLVDNSPDPIIVLNKDGRIREFNKACEQIWGCTSDYAIGRPVWEFYESWEHAKEIKIELENRPGNRIQDYNAKIKHHVSEDIIPIHLSASLLFNKENEEIGSIGVFKDLRKINRLQEEKTRAEKLVAIGNLAHTTGHDIKTDIATIQNHVRVLESKCRNDPEILSRYAVIKDASKKALNKVQNMLMATGPKPLQKEIVSIRTFLQDMEGQMRRQSDTTKVELSVQCSGNEDKLLLDKDQMRQVLTNLFGNSLDAIKERRKRWREPEKGRIEVIAQISNSNLHLYWKDNGCGISKQNLEKIFTPFFTSKKTGNGLGLYIAKSIIEKHGGQISIASEEGESTSFEIILPLFKGSASKEQN